MIESYYEFVVTYENRFYFSTSERSCPLTQTKKAKDLYQELCNRFPESEGWNVIVHKIVCYGHDTTLDFIKESI